MSLWITGMLLFICSLAAGIWIGFTEGMKLGEIKGRYAILQERLRDLDRVF